jgi:hypothetical protein
MKWNVGDIIINKDTYSQAFQELEILEVTKDYYKTYVISVIRGDVFKNGNIITWDTLSQIEWLEKDFKLKSTIIDRKLKRICEPI